MKMKTVERDVFGYYSTSDVFSMRYVNAWVMGHRHYPALDGVLQTFLKTGDGVVVRF